MAHHARSMTTVQGGGSRSAFLRSPSLKQAVGQCRSQLKGSRLLRPVEPDAIRGSGEGYYAKRGLAVELVKTPNSTELRNGLARGGPLSHRPRRDENAVAQVEIAKVDLFVFLGGNNGNGMLFARPEINSIRRPARQAAGGRRAGTAFALACLQDAAGEGSQEGRLSGQGAGRRRWRGCKPCRGIPTWRFDPEPAADRGRHKWPGRRISAWLFRWSVPTSRIRGWVLRSWGLANGEARPAISMSTSKACAGAQSGLTGRCSSASRPSGSIMPQDIIERIRRTARSSRTAMRRTPARHQRLREHAQASGELLDTWGGGPPPPSEQVSRSFATISGRWQALTWSGSRPGLTERRALGL